MAFLNFVMSNFGGFILAAMVLNIIVSVIMCASLARQERQIRTHGNFLDHVLDRLEQLERAK